MIMRSLALKFTLAVLLVGLIGAMLMAFFVWHNTQNRFDQFVVDRDRFSFVNTLAQYYQTTGSWAGVETVFSRERVSMSGSGPDSHHIALALVDGNGQVVFSQGDSQAIEQFAQLEHGRGVPIKVNSEVVGWLRFVPRSQNLSPDSPEASFLADTTQAILYSALVATIIALLLGVLLARTLTRPIRELTLATRVLAKGELGQQVSVHTRDELGELAVSFNQMSADLARASELRRQMMADIAHELRTPLSLILGYTESLSDGKLPASQETFDIMHDEAQHLSRLVDDLRTLSLADAGELPLTRRSLDVPALLERVVSAHLPEAQRRGISLRVEPPPALPAVEADPGRMAQVLENLVSNALGYTPEGGQISLSVEANKNTITLRVQDNGVGIAPEDLPFVFERFYRADKSLKRNGTESGLGLAIAKSIVEAHGGSISVESALDQGTTFTITLPVASVTSPSRN
jgi:two-component system sensor histidine kinase BaeS